MLVRDQGYIQCWVFLRLCKALPWTGLDECQILQRSYRSSAECIIAFGKSSIN